MFKFTFILGSFLLYLYLVQTSYNVVEFPIRDITWGSINFLHTTDTHGWYGGHLNQNNYNGNWGDFVSFAIKMKRKAAAEGRDLLLIDTGDKHDGNGISDATFPNGIKSLPIFMKQDYDIVTIGNHELYEWSNSELEYDMIFNHYKEKYVVSNVEIKINDTFVNLGNKFRYFETPVNKYKILSFGFLFNFTKNNKGTKVTPISEIIEQEWFLQVLDSYPEMSLDYIVIVGHIPITHSWTELDLLHKVLRNKYPNTVIQYFGGHSHIRDFVVYDENSTSLESGRFCETIGWLSVDNDKTGLEKFSRSYLDFNTNSFKHHLGTSDIETAEGNEIKDIIVKTRQELNLNQYIGRVSTNYYMDYVPIDHPHSIYKLLTEKVMGTLEKNGKDERIIIINTGGLRYDLYKGDYTLDTKYIVTPFRNTWVKLTVGKSLAQKIPFYLNQGDYIALLPATQFSYLTRGKLAEMGSAEDFADQIESSQSFFEYKKETDNMKRTGDLKHTKDMKHTKGYVTYDDFGNDGDDTVHKPVVNFPLPNVVHTVQFNDTEERDVDLVFDEFLAWNVVEALKKLTGRDYGEEVQFYSEDYLNELLTEYVRVNGV